MLLSSSASKYSLSLLCMNRQSYIMCDFANGCNRAGKCSPEGSLMAQKMLTFGRLKLVQVPSRLNLPLASCSLVGLGSLELFLGHALFHRG